MLDYLANLLLKFIDAFLNYRKEEHDSLTL